MNPHAPDDNSFSSQSAHINNQQKLYILSDLHLWSDEDPLALKFIELMKNTLRPGDYLFLVGDVFDVFVGAKAMFIERYNNILKALYQLKERNITVYFIEGNHDFHLENLFENHSHIRLFDNKLHFEWNAKSFLFTHGDTINWRDFGYVTLRALLRNILTQCLVDIAPSKLVDFVAQKLSYQRHGSADTATRVENRALHSTNDNTQKIFKNFACDQIMRGYDFVIIGHSHEFENMKFQFDNRVGQYINCGYPRKHKRYFMLSKNNPHFQAVNWF